MSNMKNSKRRWYVLYLEIKTTTINYKLGGDYFTS